MKHALKNIFAKTEVKTSVGEVVRRLSRVRVEVIDQMGRTKIVEVDSGSFYPVGAKVVMQDGVVTGSAGVLGSIKKVMV